MILGQHYCASCRMEIMWRSCGDHVKTVQTTAASEVAAVNLGLGLGHRPDRLVPDRGEGDLALVSGGENRRARERAKLRANDRRREESLGYTQPRLSQVDAISGDGRRRPATVQTHLTSEGSLARTQPRPPDGLHVSVRSIFTLGLNRTSAGGTVVCAVSGCVRR
jgi:hypothetical protein